MILARASRLCQNTSSSGVGLGVGGGGEIIPVLDPVSVRSRSVLHGAMWDSVGQGGTHSSTCLSSQNPTPMGKWGVQRPSLLGQVFPGRRERNELSPESVLAD